MRQNEPSHDDISLEVGSRGAHVSPEEPITTPGKVWGDLSDDEGVISGIPLDTAYLSRARAEIGVPTGPVEGG
jgi:hypothetical protein